jgi:hypothetical protein
MASYDDYLTNPYDIYQQYTQPTVSPSTINISGEPTVITTINGNSGQATGPAITITGGTTGYAFDATAGSLTLVVSNAATVRASISAAKSGANADINTFSALTGNTGFSAWTGTADGSAHATYPTTTASVGYVASELQGVMDKLKQITEAHKKLVDALLASGVLES